MTMPIRFLLYLFMPLMASIGLGLLCAVSLRALGVPAWVIFPVSGGVLTGSCYGLFLLLDRVTIK